jgi:CYTH domain-containing protein
VAVGREIERKFLVDAMPPDPGSGTPIAQGYLPLDAGDDVELRVRRKGERTVLTVKRGAGLERDEHEAEIGEDAFEALWSLTEGRRIEKTRYEIEHEGATIELDEYGGDLAGLLVAEVELDSEQAAEAFRPPEWVGQEVTGEARYSNRALAEDGAPG